MVLISRTRTIQGNDIASSANAVSGFVYNRQNDITSYLNLKTANEQLVAENARLHNQLATALHSTDTLRDSSATKPLPPRPADSNTHIIQYARYTYHMGRVINNSVTEKNNFFTLNIGTDNGVRKDMYVITTSGLAGRVAYVSRHFSSVLSMLSDAAPVFVYGQAKKGYGPVNWVFENRLPKPDVLYMQLNAQDTVKQGDTVYTSNISNAPPDLMIGTIYKTERIARNNKQLLYLHPANDFRNLQYAYVIENSFAAEQRNVEDSSRKPPKPAGSK